MAQNERARVTITRLLSSFPLTRAIHFGVRVFDPQPCLLGLLTPEQNRRFFSDMQDQRRLFSEQKNKRCCFAAAPRDFYKVSIAVATWTLTGRFYLPSPLPHVCPRAVARLGPKRSTFHDARHVVSTPRLYGKVTKTQLWMVAKSISHHLETRTASTLSSQVCAFDSGTGQTCSHAIAQRGSTWRSSKEQIARN